MSARIVWPLAKLAVELPAFATRIVQLKLVPAVAVPEVLLVLVAVRSGAADTVTVFEQLLLASLLSTTLLFGSTAQVPPVRGFVYVPTAVGGIAN